MRRTSAWCSSGVMPWRTLEVLLQRHLLVHLFREAGLLLGDGAVDLLVEHVPGHVDALALRVEPHAAVVSTILSDDLGRARRRLPGRAAGRRRCAAAARSPP